MAPQTSASGRYTRRASVSATIGTAGRRDATTRAVTPLFVKGTMAGAPVIAADIWAATAMVSDVLATVPDFRRSSRGAFGECSSTSRMILRIAATARRGKAPAAVSA